MIKNLFSIVICLVTLLAVPATLFSQTALTSSVSSLEFTTGGGEKIITVSGIEGTITGGHVLKAAVVSSEITVVPGIVREGRAAVLIVVSANTLVYSGYKLELRVNNVWTPVPVQINVVRELMQTVILQDPAETKSNPQSSLAAIIGVENKKLNQSRQFQLKQKINEAVKNSNVIRNLSSPAIKDWFPKDTGAIGGTFVLIGKNLDSVIGLTHGTTELPVIKRIKNSNFEAIIVQLPGSAGSGSVKVQFPVLVGSNRISTSITVNENFALVDQFSPSWPTPRATIIDITPSPDYADKPHALKQYTYSILYEYIPGNVVRDYVWKPNTDLPVQDDDRSGFRPAHGFAISISGEQGTGSGAQDASGGTFISGNMFVGHITGTITSAMNRAAPRYEREVTTLKARINAGVSSYLNSNSQARDIKRSLAGVEFEYNTPQEFTINSTYPLRTVFNFNQLYSHGTTEGISRGQSNINVGMLNISNDLAFRIASGPVGTEAVWVASPFMMTDGWKLTSFNWNEKLEFPGSGARAHSQQFNTLILTDILFGNIAKNPLEGCRNYGVYRSIFNNPRYDFRSKTIRDDRFNFSFDPENTASLTCNPVMQGDPNSYPGHMNRQNVKGMFVNLKADATLTNDHRVTMILESINLLGPRGGNSSNAFNNVVRYEPMLRAVGGHIIGISYPEFFRLLGD